MYRQEPCAQGCAFYAVALSTNNLYIFTVHIIDYCCICLICLYHFPFPIQPAISLTLFLFIFKAWTHEETARKGKESERKARIFVSVSAGREEAEFSKQYNCRFVYRASQSRIPWERFVIEQTLVVFTGKVLEFWFFIVGQQKRDAIGMRCVLSLFFTGILGLLILFMSANRKPLSVSIDSTFVIIPCIWCKNWNYMVAESVFIWTLNNQMLKSFAILDIYLKILSPKEWKFKCLFRQFLFRFVHVWVLQDFNFCGGLRKCWSQGIKELRNYIIFHIWSSCTCLHLVSPYFHVNRICVGLFNLFSLDGQVFLRKFLYF